MSVLICGSFAYDNIMGFGERFKDHILPEQLDILNVCFLTPSLRREYGGVAGNIAYNLKMIGGDPIPMGTVGEDFGPYASWMDEQEISRDSVVGVPGTMTAQAFITTDLDGNQITLFHPGAMDASAQNKVNEARESQLAIVSPDGREGMIQHAEQLVVEKIPFVFDPGQGLPMFGGEELAKFVKQAQWITVNAYEAELMQEKTGMGINDIAAQVDALIITRGAQGSDIYADGEQVKIPVAPISEALDPTGCGDAYRAGILFGIEQGLTWDVSGRIAALLGAIKIESHGTQNHKLTRSGFEARYRNSFGQSLVW
jgi:adenosine kinase